MLKAIQILLISSLFIVFVLPHSLLYFSAKHYLSSDEAAKRFENLSSFFFLPIFILTNRIIYSEPLITQLDDFERRVVMDRMIVHRAFLSAVPIIISFSEFAGLMLRGTQAITPMSLLSASIVLLLLALSWRFGKRITSGKV